MEGTYVITVNPQILKVLKNMKNDMERGLAISCMESYFKATHAFRTVSANKALIAAGNNQSLPLIFFVSLVMNLILKIFIKNKLLSTSLP